MYFESVFFRDHVVIPKKVAVKKIVSWLSAMHIYQCRELYA